MAERALLEWIARCDALGVPRREVIRELVRDGRLNPTAARAAVAAVAQHPSTAVAKELRERIQRLEWQARVRRDLAALDPSTRTVPRLRRPSRKLFLERFYSRHLPVVIRGLVDRWPAFRRWTPDYLKRRCGRTLVDVSYNRLGGAFHEINSGRRAARVRFADFVDWVESTPHSNDRYLVANNDGLRPGRLAALLRDVKMDRTLLDPSRTRGCAYLWYGPAGTVTPLHHDTTNILFCQVRGQKRVLLYSPLHTALLEHATGYYSTVQPEGLDVQPLTVELAAGEALLIPAGWWHHVTALTASLSVSLTNFVFPNDFEAGNPYARS